MDDDDIPNFGERVLRMAHEQNVSQASAARGVRIEARLEAKLARRKQREERTDA